jgi:small subunit ribosomal protein S16
MSIVIRMSRVGRTNTAHFRLGVWPKRSRRDGPAIELLGHYNPRIAADPEKVVVDLDRLQHWVGRGAEVSEAVRKFLNRRNVKLPARKSNKPNARHARAERARAKTAAKKSK